VETQNQDTVDQNDRGSLNIAVRTIPHYFSDFQLENKKSIKECDIER
jgi:hypothetical protein